MKKTILTTAVIIAFGLSSQNSQGQGFLQKLKDKVSQTGGSSSGNGVSKSGLKEAAADSTDVFLDSKVGAIDKKGLSGIYYAKDAVTGLNDNMSGNMYLKKFLVVQDDFKKLLTISSRYAFEANNRSKFVKPATWRYVEDDITPMVAATMGKLYYRRPDTDNQYMLHNTFSTEKDLQGNPKKGEMSISRWSSCQVLEYAPGIIIIYENPFSGSSVRKEVETHIDFKYRKATVLYKKEKATEAQKLNEDKVNAIFLDFSTKYAVAEDKYTTSKNELKPEKVTFKDKPSKVELFDAIKKHMSSDGWKESLVTVYPISSWTNRNELLGLTALNTLTHRNMECVMVVKKPNGDCELYDLLVVQKNAFTTGSLAEKFAGQELLFGGLTPWGGIDCAKVKK
jgi:hypothetical protein